MTPAEILAEARRWNVDISPSDARILNFASWVRAMALEECWEVVHAEQLTDPTDSPDDIAYNIAVRDCENSIRALKDQPCSK